MFEDDEKKIYLEKLLQNSQYLESILDELEAMTSKNPDFNDECEKKIGQIALNLENLKIRIVKLGEQNEF